MSEAGTGAAPAPSGPRRRRPRDRKAQILTVAAEAFSERGYHAVGIDDIAEALDISGPALYRHFPTKYAMFVHTVMRLTGILLTATDPVESAQEITPQERLDAVMTAIIEATIDNRRTGGLYRWEARYLLAEDRVALLDAVTVLNQRVREPLMQLRPELGARDAATVTAAAVSVVASITAHRSVLSAKQIGALLLDTTRGVLATELPSGEGEVAPPTLPDLEPNTKREVLLYEAIRLFYRSGYHNVSIEEIGAAAGINASGVYRHFAGKADVLAAAFHLAGERLTVTVDAALAESGTPEQAIEELVRLYVELSFQRSELMAVYFAEVGNLPREQRSALRGVQRVNIENWADLVRDARPEIGAVQARFLVHAALGLVFDMGRLAHFDLTPGSAAYVRRLMHATLMGF
ncbi:MAG: TetR/AcrR family transcriptional regulator [Rhodococcus sp. (in: high G+C Gram-positive bacteria)]